MAKPKRPVRRGKRKPPVSSEESDDDLELPNIENNSVSSGEDSDDFEISVKGAGRAGRRKPAPPAARKTAAAATGRRGRR